MDTGLKGKVVLITGAAKGIGRATALAFAREGARLALLDIDADGLATLRSEVASEGGEAVVEAADLSGGAGVSAGVDALLGAYGGEVDVLVNNVGSGAIRTFDQLTDEEWDATLQLNFMSYVRACRKVLPVLRRRGGGVIVNNASDLARQPEPVPIDYSASKAACWPSPRASPGPKGRAYASTPWLPAPSGRRSGPSPAASPRPWAGTTTCRRKRRSSTR